MLEMDGSPSFILSQISIYFSHLTFSTASNNPLTSSITSNLSKLYKVIPNPFQIKFSRTRSSDLEPGPINTSPPRHQYSNIQIEFPTKLENSPPLPSPKKNLFRSALFSYRIPPLTPRSLDEKMADKKKEKKKRKKRFRKIRWKSGLGYRRTYLDQIAGSRPRPLALFAYTRIHVARIRAHNR